MYLFKNNYIIKYKIIFLYKKLKFKSKTGKMSLDNLSLNQSGQNSQFIRQAKISSGAVNNELLKNIEILDSENS